MDPSQPSGMFWATAIGAAIGVIAGTLIQYLLTLLLDKRSLARQRRGVVKEMTYNRSLVAELTEELERFRNAVNGRVFNTYYGYFNLAKAIFAQANASAGNGFLYDMLSADDIRSLQRVVLFLSVNSENWTNGEITRRRNILLNTPNQFDHAELVRFVEFLAGQIRDVGNWIDGLIKKLS